MPDSSPALRRLVGPLGAISMVAGSMLGIGIFLTPRLVALEVPSAPLFFALWLAGGVVSLGGAAAYAELGVRFPRAGGDYVYLRETWNESLAVAAGWVLLAGVFGGSLATLASAVCRYQIPVLFPAFVPDALWLGPWTNADALALVVIASVTALNVAGIRPSSIVQTLVTVVPAAAMIGVAVYALSLGTHATTQPGTPDAARTTAGGLAAAFLHVYFAYSGWNAVSYAAEEVKDPKRNLPIGLLVGTATITGLYLLLSAAFVTTLGVDGLRDAFEAGTATTSALFGTAAAAPVAGMIAISLLGTINATALCGARTAYAMARDGLLPRSLAHVSARSHVPTRALWLQAAFAAALVVSGTFEQLLEMTSVAMIVLGGLTVAGLFRMRAQPDVERGYRALGYPWLPALYLVVSVLVVGVTGWQIAIGAKGTSAFSLLGLLALVVLYLVHASWQKRAAE